MLGGLELFMVQSALAQTRCESGSAFRLARRLLQLVLSDPLRQSSFEAVSCLVPHQRKVGRPKHFLPFFGHPLPQRQPQVHHTLRATVRTEPSLRLSEELTQP